MKSMKLYKATKPRFSHYLGYEVVDILKRKKLFGFINYWVHSDTIKNAGQVPAVINALNNLNTTQP